jgi:hypothetical protein
VSSISKETAAPRAFSPGWSSVAIVWLLAVLAGVAGLTEFSNTAGGAGEPPASWPAESQIPRSSDDPTLLVFVHPHCPCSRASIGELEVLLAACRETPATFVVFTQPEGTTDDWVETDLWRKTSAIRGVSVVRDATGAEARRFRSETSGQAVLYDPSGRLLFSGGITLSRGHAGDNPGRQALTRLLRGQALTHSATPVFGCPLFESNGDGK